jgi:ArsR family transcriptional regulator
MPVPPHRAQAELFKTLGHPVRVRVLELLCEGPRPVRDLLAEIEVEASNLSQQLAVLRRSGIVTARRQGASVTYELADGDVPELMGAARRILAHLPAPQAGPDGGPEGEPPAGLGAGGGARLAAR